MPSQAQLPRCSIVEHYLSCLAGFFLHVGQRGSVIVSFSPQQLLVLSRLQTDGIVASAIMSSAAFGARALQSCFKRRAAL